MVGKIVLAGIVLIIIYEILYSANNVPAWVPVHFVKVSAHLTGTGTDTNGDYAGMLYNHSGKEATFACRVTGADPQLDQDVARDDEIVGPVPNGKQVPLNGRLHPLPGQVVIPGVSPHPDVGVDLNVTCSPTP